MGLLDKIIDLGVDKLEQASGKMVDKVGDKITERKEKKQASKDESQEMSDGFGIDEGFGLDEDNTEDVSRTRFSKRKEDKRHKRLRKAEEKFVKSLEKEGLRDEKIINIQNQDIDTQQADMIKNNVEINEFNRSASLQRVVQMENMRKATIMENEKIIEHNNDILDRQEAVLKKEKANSNSGFNFYKVKDLMEENTMTFVSVVDEVGMVPNVAYNLDYDGNKIIRVHNRNVDDLCINLKQNRVFAKLIEDKTSIVCIVGNPHVTDFEIGILVTDPNFGAVMFTRYKSPDIYLYDVGDRMIKEKLIGYNQRPDIKLSKSFVKLAFSSAICIDLTHGIMSAEDLEMYDSMCKENELGKENLNRLLSALGITISGIKKLSGNTVE